MWRIIIQNNGFEGIKPTPNPNPNADGSYTVKLTTTQWQIFQDNQKKPQLAVPELPEQAQDDDNVTASQDPSML